VAVAVGAIARARTPGMVTVASPSPVATPAQRRARWRQSLARPSGWDYALRLTACLAVAILLRWLWPDHHLHWIALTVVILCQRQVEAAPVRVTQRALGAVVGVALAGLLLVLHPPAWSLVAAVGLLAGARPLLQARNYLAYSALMTPLVMLILDAGQPLAAGTLADRLIATLAGVVLVLGSNRASREAWPPRA
jgi:uncharacterized membrane protein YccC